jgi:hypothetical protein
MAVAQPVSLSRCGRYGNTTAARTIMMTMMAFRTTMKIKNGTSAGCRSRRGDGAVVGTGCDGMECSCPEECGGRPVLTLG